MRVKKRRTAPILLGLFLGLLLILVVGPFLIPLPPDADARTVEELADADSRFIELNGIQVHYKQAGQGGRLILLLHGFLASSFSWREVIEPLSPLDTVIAFDRPAFGLTERPLNWEGENPYTPEAQADLVIALIDQLGFDRAILVGNSAGGTVAMFTALRYPDRVQSLVLVDAAIYTGGGAPDWAKPLLGLPQARRLGPFLLRNFFNQQTGSVQDNALLTSAWHEPEKVTPEILAGYSRSFQVAGWERALWEFTLASRDLKLSERLEELQLPVLVITGDDDRIVPTAESIRLAQEISGAQLVVIPNCGHVPHEECPQAFLEAVQGFLSERAIR
jgi:pimeloyl-ACP methyl ester carboxylesterase